MLLGVGARVLKRKGRAAHLDEELPLIMNYFSIQWGAKTLKLTEQHVGSDGSFNCEVDGNVFAGKFNRKLSVLQIECDGVFKNVMIRNVSVLSQDGDIAEISIEAHGLGNSGESSIILKREKLFPGLSNQIKKPIPKDITIKSPMAGKIIRVRVNAADVVPAGTLICIVEAMKMENKIITTRAGTVKSCTAKEGSTVAVGDELARIGT